MAEIITGGIYETPIDLSLHGMQEYYKKELDSHKNGITSQYVCVWRPEPGATPVLLHSNNFRHWTDDSGQQYEDMDYFEKEFQIA